MNKEDMEKLEFLFKAGKTAEDLTEIFNCSLSTINRKLKQMELI